MSRSIKKNISWVGRKDGDLQAFHGLHYPTNEGFSYNSYLVREEKVALIDTVWAPYAQEFVENLEREIELQRIDFIIACHAEIDSSGALPALMERIPDTPIYCTASGVDSLVRPTLLEVEGIPSSDEDFVFGVPNRRVNDDPGDVLSADRSSHFKVLTCPIHVDGAILKSPPSVVPD